MSPSQEQQIELPDPHSRSGNMLVTLSARGLEWEGGRSRALWMPFACMRRITLGSVPQFGGWRMRVSGPPGSLVLAASHYGALQADEAAERFCKLAATIISEAAQIGCGPKLRMNDRFIAPDFVWARTGQRIANIDFLLKRLEVSPK